MTLSQSNRGTNPLIVLPADDRLVISGEVDAVTAPQFENALEASDARILDLREVAFFSSAGASVLEHHAGRFDFIAASLEVCIVLDALGLAHMIDLRSDEPHRRWPQLSGAAS